MKEWREIILTKVRQLVFKRAIFRGTKMKPNFRLIEALLSEGPRDRGQQPATTAPWLPQQDPSELSPAQQWVAQSPQQVAQQYQQSQGQQPQGQPDVLYWNHPDFSQQVDQTTDQFYNALNQQGVQWESHWQPLMLSMADQMGDTQLYSLIQQYFVNKMQHEQR